MAGKTRALRLKKALPGTGKPRGGARPGAGRKPNSIKNLAAMQQALNVVSPGIQREVRAEQLLRIIGSPNDPLLLLINEARDRTNSPEIRVTAAAHACRYCHPSLSTQQVNMTHQTASNTGDVLSKLEARLANFNATLPMIEAEVTTESETDAAIPEVMEAAL